MNITEFEKQLLGCMLIDNSIIDEVSSMIRKEYFLNGQYGRYYEKILQLYTENGSCDILMLSNQFVSKLGSEIVMLTEDIASASNFEYYAKQIKNNYTARFLKQELSNKLSTVTPENISDSLYQIDDIVNNCMNDTRKALPVDGRQMTERTLELLQDRKNHFGTLTGFDTGYDKLNLITDGLQKGNLVAIGARTSLGKSAFSDQLCVNIASKGIKTVNFSLEMIADEIGERRTSYLSNVPIRKLRRGTLSALEIGRINNSLRNLYDYGENLILYDSDSVSCEFKDIESKIRIHAKKGAQVFFIDHIGLVDCEEMAGAPEWERIGYITKRLKQLANKLKIVIVIVCQLTRDSEGKEPQLNQVRGSGCIEQDCNTVILIHRERQKAEETEIPTKIKVVKNRGGSCGDIDFIFYPETTKFKEVTYENEEAA